MLRKDKVILKSLIYICSKIADDLKERPRFLKEMKDLLEDGTS